MLLFVAILVIQPATLLLGSRIPVACYACIHDAA